MRQTTKAFMIGRSQAVRLPAAFRFDSEEVFIHRDPVTGDVILSRKPDSWDGFLSLLEGDTVSGDFLGEQERKQAVAASRDPFEGMDE
jgi:antitoxin VapB